MAKKIFATELEIAEFLRSAQAQLIAESHQLKTRKFQNAQADDIILKFKLADVKDDRKATITFSERAWIKTHALIHTYSTEVEWHGVAERIADNSFYIKDILIFPHRVTGATVTSDQKEYESWLDTLDDEIFNSLRFHGHSHVNMSVNPSSVDMEYRKSILNNFGSSPYGENDFYIFLIFNKRKEISGEIYDLKNNAIYSTDEIIISHNDAEWIEDFLREAKSLVKEDRCYGVPYAQTTQYTGNKSTNALKESTSQQCPKHSAKYDATQSSLFDDDDYPDPLDPDYYEKIYGMGRYKNKGRY